MDQAAIEGLAQQLADAVRESFASLLYVETKNKIAGNPGLETQIKEFKRAQMDYRFKHMEGTPITFEEEQNLSKIYSDLLLHDDARVFLDSERKLLDMITKIQNMISGSCPVELDF